MHVSVAYGSILLCPRRPLRAVATLIFDKYSLNIMQYSAVWTGIDIAELVRDAKNLFLEHRIDKRKLVGGDALPFVV
jgi:hypothetical protein